MKTIIFKILLPFTAPLFAIGVSFTTNVSEKKFLAMTNGYIVAPNTPPCSVNTQCCSGNVVCSMVYMGQAYQAFGKILPTDTTCNKIVYKC